MGGDVYARFSQGTFQSTKAASNKDPSPGVQLRRTKSCLLWDFSATKVWGCSAACAGEALVKHGVTAMHIKKALGP